MIQMIPLSRLSLSDLNVRKTDRSADIAQLAQDIAERGLKQNLVVIPNGNDSYFEVVAGGRRFQAMQLLVSDGQWDADREVPAIVEPREQGVETSLSENLHRVAMNPADEFEAFRTVIDQAEGTEDERVAYCARRFGVSEAIVRGRLRLHGLASPILDALRANRITLAAATAYASVDDQKVQEAVFAIHEKPNAWQPHDPRRIKDELAKKTYSASDPRLKFVGGRERYVEAGGRVDSDMFSTDATERLLDPSILDKLVKQEFEKQAPKLAKKLKVKGVVLANDRWGGGAKAPAGWVLKNGITTHRDGESVDEVAERIADRKPTMLHARIDEDGKLVRCDQVHGYFWPQEEAEASAEARDRPEGAPRDWEAERAARERANGVRAFAFRAAFPKLAGTALEGRIFYQRYARFEERDDLVLLEVQAAVTRDELDACLAEAEAGFDAELAERERIRAEIAAEQEREKAAMIESPPAVVEVDAGGGVTLFRCLQGRYLDIDIDFGEVGEEQYAEFCFDSIEELLSEVEVLAHWPTIESYREHRAAQQVSSDPTPASPQD